MAFSLNPVMKAYLPYIKELNGKKAACIIAQGLPADWMGGKQAVKSLSVSLKSKGADVATVCIVHCNKNKDKQTADAVSSVCGIF
jgi:FMN-dependent NADH-azoreductase